MVISKINKPLTPITPQELAQKIASEGMKGAVDKAIEISEKEYRAHYKRLLELKKPMQGIQRFRPTEADSEKFMEEVYKNLPSFFKKMIDSAVEEQARISN